MIKVENIDVWGFEHAIRGTRNPLNSWKRMDSGYCKGASERCDTCDIRPSDDYAPCYFANEMKDKKYILGKNDLDLMRRLYKAGPEHRKYLRQIFVSVDITAPLYWWKEFDTYKVGTVANSCSTMHKIAAKEFELDDFSFEHLFGEEADDIDSPLGTLSFIVDKLNEWRDEYIRTKEKNAWWQLIQLLPSSYNQRRTITMNYENAVTMIKQRTNHKLDEWNQFVEVLKTLPYIKEIMEV